MDDIPPFLSEDFGFTRLVGVMDRLRDPGGCPWDAEQDLQSLKPFLIEEAYEVLEAMDRNPEEHCEELGDLLLQVVFHARIRREQGEFEISDVVRAICDKLIRRHPHVFSDAKAETADEVLRQWELNKAKEGKPGGSLGGVPRSMPALLQAQRLTDKASSLGFDWSDRAPVVAKIREELGELEETLVEDQPAQRVREELGDVLFSMVNLARHLGVDAEGALRASSDRFVRRFRAVERGLKARDLPMAEATLEQMDQEWQRAKDQERDQAPETG